MRWVFKYKLHHIPFWLFYNYLLWVLATGNPAKAANSLLFTPMIAKFLFYVTFPALAVYFNLYFLIPRWLEKGKFTLYIIFLVLTILVASILIVPGYYISAHLYGSTVKKVYGEDCWYKLFIANPLPATIATMTLGMSIKLTKNWLQTQRRQQALENEKLETELNFLKYQFNPHFLFNTINSIFFLIHKNPDKASSSLAKFSELLRYQLYECNDEQILLSKEIDCLRNSIELEKLRQNDNFDVDLQVNTSHMGDAGVAPFILMTFVENAFKHVSKHADRPNWIRIVVNLDPERRQLNFYVANSTAHHSLTDVVRYGGIGLKNVQRRLDLIYPGQHELNIQSYDSRFEVRLQLGLRMPDGPSLTNKTINHDQLCHN